MPYVDFTVARSLVIMEQVLAKYNCTKTQQNRSALSEDSRESVIVLTCMAPPGHMGMINFR